jgi:hypothetical protein
MRIIDARGLSANPTDAAAEFMAETLPRIRAAIGAGDLPLCVAFDPADHTHAAWRVAAIQALAREAAPGRVNGVSGVDEAALEATSRYLQFAEGVTGQYLPLDGQGAGNPAE